MKPIKLSEGSSLFLDIVRAFSVQLVVIGHGLSFCSIAIFIQPPYFADIQNIAVVIFFILSGFLISNSVFYKISNSSNYSFKSYFIDRFSRIYAAFIPALFFILILDYISQSMSPAYEYSEAFNIKTLIGNVFMLQDFPFLKYLNIKITSFGSGRPLWTLAIEWWIYLWFGFFIFNIIKKRKISLFSVVLFAFLCIVPAYNLIGGRGNGLTLFWLFGLFILLFYNKYQSFQFSKITKLGIVTILLLLAGIIISRTKEAYDPIFAFLLAFALMTGMELFSTIRFNLNTSKIIRLVANYSYTLYLIHYTIYDFILNQFKSTIESQKLFILGFVASNIFSLLIGYYTETKFTLFVKEKLKKQLLKEVKN